MKIHILYKFVEGPWGGANQFLKALRDYFRKMGVYSESPDNAEVILFNSHHFFDEVFRIKKKYPNKILIHRVDGPISHVRGKDKIVDEIVHQFNKIFADGTIFISNWSRKNNYLLGMKKSKYETIILSAPNPAIFNPKGKRHFNEKRVRLIATSWSGNIRKGFDIYKFLDEHLDFTKYEMTFVGNSPIEFKNIRWIKPVPSQELAGILKQYDIYITASKSEPFGQTVIEALHCGLPAVVRSGGGYLEITGNAVEVFNDERDVIDVIDKIAKDYDYYQQQINLPTINVIGQRYYDFAQNIYEYYLSGDYHPKDVNSFSTIKFTWIKIKIANSKALNVIRAIMKRTKTKGEKGFL